MKLFKKLIPIASLASVAAVVVPLATSCQTESKTNEGITVDLYDFINNGYERTIAALPASTQISSTDGLKTYLKYVKENPKIFADDLYDAIDMGLKKILNLDITPKQDVTPVYTDMVGDVTVKDVSTDVEGSRLSFTINLDIVLPIEQKMDDGTVTRYEIKANGSFRLENIAVGMKYDTTPIYLYGKQYHMWNIYPDYYTTPYSVDDKWSLSVNGWLETSILDIVTHIDLDYKLSNKADDAVLGYLTEMFNNIDIPAMYFKNIVASDYKDQ